MPYDAPKTPLYLRLSPADDVVIALRDIAAGTRLEAEAVTAAEKIPAGHKLAVRAKRRASRCAATARSSASPARPIAPGAHVHTHNLEMRDFARDYAFGADVKPVAAAAAARDVHGHRAARRPRRHAQLHRRHQHGELLGRRARNGWPRRSRARRWRRSPTSTASCRSPTRPAAAWPRPARASTCCAGPSPAMRATPISAACSSSASAARPTRWTRCSSRENLTEADLLKPLIIQQQGGTAKTVAAGIDAVRKMLPLANNVKREPVPASHITVGLQCGGSDGYSGITANPALGAAVDLLVRHGGTAILSETPEIYGAEHLLTRRAVSRAVGEKLIARIKWWEDYTARNKGEMNNNPSPGNKAGGLTTILEKSLGRRRQGRHHQPRRRLRICRAGDREGLRLHGHARLRPGLGDRAGGGRRQHHLLHHRPRLGLRLQARALAQARHQLAHLPPHGRRHGRELRHHRRGRRHRGGEGAGDLRAHPPRRLGRARANPRPTASAPTSSCPGRSAR